MGVAAVKVEVEAGPEVVAVGALVWLCKLRDSSWLALCV